MKAIIDISKGIQAIGKPIVFAYPILISLDIFSTFVATPNLMYEGNLIIRYFQLGWFEIVTYAIAGSAFLLIGTLYGIGNLQSKKRISILKRTVFSLIVTLFFYHFSYSVFVIFNNAICVLYLKEYDLLKGLSSFYIDFVRKYPNLFYEIIHLIFFIFGGLLTWKNYQRNEVLYNLTDSQLLNKN